MNWFLILAVVGHAAVQVSCQPTTVTSVQTKHTKFYGTRDVWLENIYDQYLGIPYAEPPIRDRRYQKPHPVKHHPEKYDAVSFKKGCWQIRHVVEDCISPSENPFDHSAMSEDCLYLNIWISRDPRMNGTLLPTLLWINNGGMLRGSASRYSARKEFNSNTGNLIIMTFNWRLGSFGFLKGDRDEEPGNVGLYDIVACLEWIQRNIGYFGGDKHDVTIAGELAVPMLLTSDLAKGLFHRAIALGAPASVPTVIQTQHENRIVFKEYIELLGCDQREKHHLRDPLKCLRSKPANELAKADYLLLKKKGHKYRFTVSEDKHFACFESLYPFRPKHIHSVKLIHGVNRDAMFSLMYFIFPEMYESDAPRLTKKHGMHLIKNLFEQQYHVECIDPVIKEYFKGCDEHESEEGVFKTMSKLCTDFYFTCPSLDFSNYYSSKVDSLYHYYYTHVPSQTPFSLLYKNVKGALYLNELPFAFGIPLLNKTYNYDPCESRFSLEVFEFWTSFAKTGVPALSCQATGWVPYTQTSPNSFELAPMTMTPTRIPQRHLCRSKLWTNVYKDYYKHRKIDAFFAS